MCFVVLLREGNRFFFVAYFLLFFVIFWLKFSLTTFPSFRVVLHFLITVVFFIIIGNEETLLRREREIKRERFEREFFDSRGETRLVNTRAHET